MLNNLLSKHKTIAAPDFNRWLVPPAALCIHLCIGMAYGFSVFWLPLTKAIGITRSVQCPASMGFFEKLVTTTCDWDRPLLGWLYTLFFVFLGSSAAIFGTWLERAGPRKAGVVSALCWCGGLVISAIGVYWHQLWLLWLGSGVIGGIGLGLGYISPVSTLLKWFPDRRGMAAGMAIMGFGGGAMIGSPLAAWLMKYFAGPESVGVWETFLVLAGIYFLFMLLGAFTYRLPPDGWVPQGTTSVGVVAGKTLVATPAAGRFVTVNQACKTYQFWLLWWVLCLNVSAGIGVIGMASPMLQEILGGRLLGESLSFEKLDSGQLSQLAVIGAGFTGLLSLFNIAGRFFWATLSDVLGRKITFSILFLLGVVLYAGVPWAGQAGNIPVFCGIFCLILTMYGGGFAAIPAYLADLFGTQNVAAIHGRLLTAWSVAGILGPVLVNYLNDFQFHSGVPRSAAYDQTMYLLAGLLAVGFFCNMAVRPVAEQLFDGGADSSEHPAGINPKGAAPPDSRSTPTPSHTRSNTLRGRCELVVFWLIVVGPLSWGFWMTLKQGWVLFR